MNCRINYLKNKLKDDELNTYEIQKITEELQEIERFYQKQTLENKLYREYEDMIKLNNNEIDREKYFIMSIINIKNNRETLKELLIGKFGYNVIYELEKRENELGLLNSRLKDFEESIII